MDRDADEVTRRLGRVRLSLHRLRGAGAEDVGDVAVVLQLDVGGRDAAHIAPGSGERDPWRRSVQACGGHVVVGAAADLVRPVLKSAREAALRSVRSVEAVAVRYREALLVGVEAGQRRDDVVGGMRDQRGVVMADHRAVALDEVEQAWHLLEV